MSAKRKKALGRGLEALLPEVESSGQERTMHIDADLIDSNPFQPRKNWNQSELHSLSESIKVQGILQPVIVRKHGTRYQLIAGERRLKAGLLAGLERIPVVIRSAGDEEMLALALMENVQRKDLGPIEKAEAFSRLSTEFGLTQEKMAEYMGLARSTIANFERLLELPLVVRKMLEAGDLSMGHGRAILGLSNNKDMERIARKIVKRGLNVRQTEEIVRTYGRIKLSGKKPVKSPEVMMLEKKLQRRFGTKIRIIDKKGKGKIEITYNSLDELDRLLELMNTV